MLILTRVENITCFCFNYDYKYNYSLKFSIAITNIQVQLIVIQLQFKLQLQWKDSQNIANNSLTYTKLLGLLMSTLWSCFVFLFQIY